MSRENPIAPSDTVPAMLTPGEAVLNAEAAELLGRENIKALNHRGLTMRRKGIIPVQGYANGTDYIAGSPVWSSPSVGVGGDYYAQRAQAIEKSGGIEPPPAQSPSVQQTSFGGANVSKQGSSYSQTGKANDTTGLTAVGGGTNAQSLVNQATQVAPPLVGLAGQGTAGASNEAASIQAQTRKQLSSPVQTASAPVDLSKDLNTYSNLTQGYADGTDRVKLGSLATQASVQKAIVPVTNSAPATIAPKSTGIVPMGQSWHDTVEPPVEKVQMRNAPPDWYANTSEGKASRMTEEMGKAASYKPPKIDPTMAERMAGSANYTPPKVDPYTGEVIKSGTNWGGVFKNVGDKAKSIAKAAPGAIARVAMAPETTVPVAMAANEALLKRKMASGDTSAVGLTESIPRMALHMATHPAQTVAAVTGAGDVSGKVTAPVNTAYEGVKSLFGGKEQESQAPESKTSTAGGEDKTADEGYKAAQEGLGAKSFPSIDMGKPSVDVKQTYSPDQISAFEKEGSAVSKGKNGIFKYVKDGQGNIVKVDSKTGNQTVMAEPIGKGESRGDVSEGTRQFWENQGMSADPAERRAQKEAQEQQRQMQELQNIALYGGGTGDMTFSEYFAANRRQKAAQGILNEMRQANTQQGTNKANLAAAKEDKLLARASAQEERKYQRAKDEQASELAERRLTQERELAENKPGKYTLSNGETFNGTQAQYEQAEQVVKQKADDEAFKALVNRLDTVTTSRDTAIDEAMAQSDPVYRGLRAQLVSGKLPPEKVKAVEQALASRRTAREGALSGE